MKSGKSVYRSIERRVEEALERLGAASERVQRLGRDLEGVRGDETRALARLAKVRLGELEGGRIAAELDRADRAALDQLAKRERERERLHTAIQDGARDLADMIGRRGDLAAARDAAVAAHRAQLAATMARLAEDEDYRVQRTHCEFVAQKASNADRKAAMAEDDREEKRKPYEGDKLFAYLWQRRFQFPEYRAWPLFRTLDQWVARLCRYDTAHRDYGMLLEIPVRLRAHADLIAQEAEAEIARLSALETSALAADGETALRERGEAAQAKVDAVEERIRSGEAAQDRLHSQAAAAAAGNDPWSRRATDLIQAQLAREDVLTLHRDALATPTPEDDQLAREISGLRRRGTELDADLSEAKAAQAAAQRAHDDIESVRRRFRRRDFDSDKSLFDDDFDIGNLLGQLCAGVMRSSAVWSLMKRRQRWRPTSSSSGGIFGSLGSSSSGGFGGGFSSGGFSSGGGFGGGGGFSTGGGF